MRSRKKKPKIIYRISFYIILALLILVGTVYAVNNYSKGELNGDKIIDYADVNLLEQHLIHIQELPKEKQGNADMNNDGKITLTDLSLLIQKIERQRDYKVELTNIHTENDYPNKNQEIEIGFLANINYNDVYVQSVVVNGNAYNVETPEQTGNTYQIKINVGNQTGIQEYKFTKVILNTNEEVKINHTFVVSVLKERPFIDEKSYKLEETFEGKANVSFDLVDQESSIISAIFTVYEKGKTEAEDKQIMTTNISAGNNKQEIPVEDGKTYRVNILVNYNLALEQLEGNEHRAESINYSREFTMALDYNFKLSDMKALKNGEESNKFEKNEPIQILFNSTNSAFESTTNSDFEPAIATINGKEYTVTKQENQYTVIIDGISLLGENTITIQKVKLGNGKEFILDQNNNITVTIQNKKPSVSNFEAQENVQDKQIKLKFGLVDDQKTIQNAKIELYDKDGTMLESQDITSSEIENGTIEKILKTAKTARYTVKVIATYKETDSSIVENSVIFEKEIPAVVYVEIKKAETNQKVVEKNQTVDITYEIETNSESKIVKICVNNTNYIVSNHSEGIYEVTVDTGNRAQVLDLETTKIILEDGKEFLTQNTLKVDVLKEMLTIEESEQEDNPQQKEITVSFKVNDVDNSFICGKVLLEKTTNIGQVIQESEISFDQNGDGKVTFSNIEENVEYIAKFLVTYNRYTEKDDQIIENQVIAELPIILVMDYHLQISDLKTLNENKETKYFEKNELIKFGFAATTTTGFMAEKAVINGVEYELVKENDRYIAQIPGFATNGVQELKLEKIILDNKVELDITNEQKVEIEVLKEKPTITNFAYTESVDDKNKVIVSFDFNDPDQTLKQGIIIISDYKKSEVKTKELVANRNEVIFDKTSSEYYIVKVVADYTTDTTGATENTYKDQILLKEEIEFTARKIEMKDVLDVTLYKKDGEEVKQISSIKTWELENKEQYLVNVQMKDLPDFYAPIKAHRVENNELIFELEYENITQYKENMNQDKLDVVYGTVEGYIATSNSFANLIAQIRKNPSGTFNLTRDYDASNFSGDNRALVGEGIVFTGTINGNGHKIYNLSKPLFHTMQKATVKDLVLEKIHLSNTNTIQGRGALANEINSGSTINNVHVKDMTITTHYMLNDYGGITGRLTGSKIEKSSVTNLTITSSERYISQNIGGITGYINSSTVEDCYVTGKLKGKTRVGGIAGFVEEWYDIKSTIKHCITKVNIQSRDWSNGSGGIVGHARLKSQIELIQNISLSTGSGAHRVYGGTATLDDRTYNYAMAESSLMENTDEGIKTISQNDFSGEFCKNEAKFDETIWNLDHRNYDNLPTLNNSDPNNSVIIKENTKYDYYIPDQERLAQMPEYNENKKMIYSNLYKLMPFYDAKYIVIDGQMISEDHILNQKDIKTILPYDGNDKLIFALTENNYKNLKSIRVVFADNTTEDYTLDFKELLGNVVSYNIHELSVEYNYDKYIIKQDADIVNELITYIQNLEYEKDLQTMVQLDRGHTAYKVHFNETIRTKENAENFVYHYLANVSGYGVTENHDILNTMIKNKLITNHAMKRTLFAYNYYSRLYGVNMDGTNLSDVLLFKGEIYGESVRFNDLINDFWNSEWKNSHVNYQFYLDVLGTRVGIPSSGELIDYSVKILTDYKDPNDWFTDTFSGLLVEKPGKGHEEADYRAWTQLKKQYKYILPILTLPEDSGYMISTPGIFFIGSQRGYIKNPKDESQRKVLLTKMETFADQVSVFYGTTLGFIDKSYVDRVADIAIDRPYAIEYGNQNESNCTEIFHQSFNELMNEWPAPHMTGGGIVAYSGDQKMTYITQPILTTYDWIWSHETGHNQTARIFFKNNGFRTVADTADGITGNENYTDGNTTQQFGDGSVNFNLSYNYTEDKLVTSNLTTERIDSTEKIESYYKRMFEVIDFLDYVEAKAFLQLTPEEQSKVATKVYYPIAPTTYSIVGWKPLTKEDFEKMNLKTIDDIYQNQIIIKPGVTGDSNQTDIGSYGSENMYIRRWYQPFNDTGRTHSYGFKYTAWQMLGIGGYDNGYITYYSGKSKNDLDAIRKITKDDTMTWDKFKKERYQLMQDNWDNIPYLDANTLVDRYVEALKIDAANHDRNVSRSTNIRRINYHYLKRATDDFRNEVFDGTTDIIHIKTAEELKQKILDNPTGYYVLDNDIDISSLSGENAIIDGYFMGKLDGKGHKLTGNTQPIFNCLKFAQVSNLKIENSKITSDLDNVGSLARTIEYSQVDSILGSNIQITGTKKQIGGLTGSMANSYATNIHMTDAKISGDGRVGALAGYVGASQIEESSTNGTVISKANATGGFIGEIYNGTAIRNSYSVGKAEGAKDIGGFVGYVNNSSIDHCFSYAQATGTEGIASFVGQTIENSKIRNNITLVDQMKGYKFDGRTANKYFTNFSGNYENKANIGASTLSRNGIDFTGKITVAEEADVRKETFYTQDLGWDNRIWDFTKIGNGGLPKLRNSDPNDISTEANKETIETPEEFETKLNANPQGTFVIKADLDLSSLTNNSTIITETFKGRIQGNNHVLSGNKVPIFNNLQYAQISDLTIEGSTISANAKDVGALAKEAQYVTLQNIVAKNITIKGTNQEVGGLVGIMTKSEVENVHIIDSFVSGTNRVGLLVGYVGMNTKFKQSSSEGIITATGSSAGGLVGETITSTSFENCYSIATVQGGQNVGGFIGSMSETSITNSFSGATVMGEDSTGGVVGKTLNGSTIKNTISLGNQAKQYKFDGGTEKEQFEKFVNNYEYEENAGISTLTRQDIDFAGKISIAKRSDITNPDFYTNILGWDSEVWDLSNVANSKIPKLKNLDPNKSRSIIISETISSVDELIEKLSTRPDGTYTIQADLDFSSKDYKVGSIVIERPFVGKIEGNGYTIKNLSNATIFKQFSGEVSNLNMDNFQYGVVWFGPPYENWVSPGQSNKSQSNIAAFAKKASKATFYNMNFNKMIMFGSDNVAVVVADDKDSKFEEISVSKAYLNCGESEKQGNNCSTFIGRKTGGTIKNCYVQGELYSDGKDCGGIIGACLGDVTIENTVSNILSRNNSKNQNGKTTGLFIGKLEGKNIMRNSIAIGKRLEGMEINNFVTLLENTSIDGIENCYENGESSGISNSNGVNIKQATKEDLLNKNFYVDVLHFDENIWELNDIKEIIYIDSPFAHNPDFSKFPKIISFGLKD